jgi:hypothetical protein
MIGRNAVTGRAAAALGLAMSASAASAGDKVIAAPAKPKPAGGSSKTWSPPKTPWGDPDLRGTWPLDALGRTPFQRPAKFGDRAYLSDQEYQAALKEAAEGAKAAEREEKANTLGAGHWLERGQPLRQTSLIVEPANGQLPPMTAAGKARAAAMRSSWTETV